MSSTKRGGKQKERGEGGVKRSSRTHKFFLSDVTLEETRFTPNIVESPLDLRRHRVNVTQRERKPTGLTSVKGND